MRDNVCPFKSCNQVCIFAFLMWWTHLLKFWKTKFWFLNIIENQCNLKIRQSIKFQSVLLIFDDIFYSRFWSLNSNKYQWILKTWQSIKFQSVLLIITGSALTGDQARHCQIFYEQIFNTRNQFHGWSGAKGLFFIFSQDSDTVRYRGYTFSSDQSQIKFII